MPTSTYKCPNCNQGNLYMNEIKTITFRPHISDSGPVIVDITGIAKCNSCDAEYKLDAKDIHPATGKDVFYEPEKHSSSLEEN